MQHLAAIAALGAIEDDRFAEAARLMGYVDARRRALDLPRLHADRVEYDKMLAALREGLGEVFVAELMMEGCARERRSSLC